MEEEDIYLSAPQETVNSDEGMDVEWEEGEDTNAVPSQEEVEKMLVHRRKKVYSICF